MLECIMLTEVSESSRFAEDDRSVACNIIDFGAARSAMLAAQSEVNLIDLVDAALSPNGLSRRFEPSVVLPKGISLVFNNPDDADEPSTRFRATAPLPLRPVFEALAASGGERPSDRVGKVFCALSLWLQDDAIAAV
jgi:hypothetical protein